MKSVLVDFLVGAGIKPTSIVSYNHLGNNDGMNLSAPQTFRSKEISKSNVVDDMVSKRTLLHGCMFKHASTRCCGSQCYIRLSIRHQDWICRTMFICVLVTF